MLGYPLHNHPLQWRQRQYISHSVNTRMELTFFLPFFCSNSRRLRSMLSLSIYLYSSLSLCFSLSLSAFLCLSLLFSLSLCFSLSLSPSLSPQQPVVKASKLLFCDGDVGAQWQACFNVGACCKKQISLSFCCLGSMTLQELHKKLLFRLNDAACADRHVSAKRCQTYGDRSATGHFGL